MKKRYTIGHDWLSWECVVEIDETTAAAPIREMVQFWHGWERRLAFAHGDYTAAFLYMLAVELLHTVLSERSASTIQEHFKDFEGWVPMDGSHGITIVSCDDYAFEDAEFTITAVR